MRRELIFHPGISEPDDQFHAAIPNHVGTAASAVRLVWGRGSSPVRRAQLGSSHKLLLPLLLRLLRLLRSSLGALFLSLLFTLLDNLGLGRNSSRFRCYRFRSRHNLFLHRGYVGHRLGWGPAGLH